MQPSVHVDVHELPSLAGTEPVALLPRLTSLLQDGAAVKGDTLFPRGRGLRSRYVCRGAEGFQDCIRFPDDSWLIISDFPVARTVGQRYSGEDVVKFHVKLSGVTPIGLSTQEHMVLAGPAAFIISQPLGVEKWEFVLKDNQESSVTVIYRRSHLLAWFDEQCSPMSPRLRSIIGPESAKQAACAPVHLSPMIVAVARDLLQSPYQGTLRVIHAEAKARELSCMILNQLAQGATDQVCDVVLSHRDVERLHEAKDILARNIIDPPTIDLLSRRVALNQKKLRVGFKVVFGESTFDYCQRLRMERARELLDAGETSLVRISEAVGYAYPSSFSVAFKRYYGVLPKDVRGRGRSLTPRRARSG
ncbi:MAG TPA: AraC family transcriptional regulator [Steroidobacter sp.]|uniref:helix-turn-helix domain-containing protein n=1 Tax=Steroidobacter sp. TaxID=1978227 RepID=UPI002EDB973C